MTNQTTATKTAQQATAGTHSTPALRDVVDAITSRGMQLGCDMVRPPGSAPRLRRASLQRTQALLRETKNGTSRVVDLAAPVAAALRAIPPPIPGASSAFSAMRHVGV